MALASLLMNRAASQGSISPFLAASASQKIEAKKTNSRLPDNMVMISGWSPGTSIKSPISFSIIRPNTYAATMAWTCRQELRLEKFLTMPLKISLGSKEQVDWLEGKNQAPR
jgi:hypothetical protein